MAENRHPVSVDSGIEDFFKQHYTGLLRYLAARKADMGLAEEIANDAFLVVHLKWSTLSEPEKRKAYLFAVATRMWRKRSPRRDRQLLELASEQVEIPCQADAIEEIIGHEHLLALLAQLSTRHRQVLLLEYAYGFKIGAIAGILGVSNGTVKRYGHEARHALAKLFRGPELFVGSDEGRNDGLRR